MRKYSLLIILALVGWSVSCDTPLDTLNDDPSDHTDCPSVNMPISSDSYPSSYYPLPYSKLQEAKAEYKEINDYQVCSTLDEYGWPDGSLTNCLSREWLHQEITDEDRMISMAKELILKNRRFTCVMDTSALVIRRSVGSSGSNPGSNTWMVSYLDQMYQGLKVLDAGIFIQLDNETAYRLGEHWYPEIYIPETDQISPESARESLVGTEIVWHGFSGEPNIYTVTSESFMGETEKTIVPIRDENSVELRVTWRFSIKFLSEDYPSWYIYVDTSTGETIRTDQLFDT